MPGWHCQRLGVRPISEIVVEVGFERRDVHVAGLRGLDGSSHLQVGLEPEAVVQLVVDQEVDQVVGHARIVEVLVGDESATSDNTPQRRAGTIDVEARLRREVIERGRRIQPRVQVGVAGGGEEMRIGLVVELEFGAGDVRIRFLVDARAGGYLASPG